MLLVGGSEIIGQLFEHGVDARHEVGAVLGALPRLKDLVEGASQVPVAVIAIVSGEFAGEPDEREGGLREGFGHGPDDDLCAARWP